MIIRTNFGSAYCNGLSMRVGAFVTQNYKVDSLSIGETIRGKEIQWVLVNGLFIADRCILTGISWDQLEANDLVYGNTKISIGGFEYRIRLLKGEDRSGTQDEWDAALDAVGDDSDEVWHWKKQLFWEQATGIAKTNRVVRGGRDARSSGSEFRFSRIIGLGWRPVLVPETLKLGSDQIGKNLLLMGETGESVSGQLVEISDYDLLLAYAGTPTPNNSLLPSIVKRFSEDMIAVKKEGLVLAQRFLT